MSDTRGYNGKMEPRPFIDPKIQDSKNMIYFKYPYVGWEP